MKGTEPYGGAALTKKMEENITGPLYKSQTPFENVLRTVGNFGAGALFPGGILTRAANVVVPALATEAAGALTNDNPIAKTAAALAGGFGVSKIGRIAETAAAKAALPATPTSVEDVRAALPEMYNTPAIQTTEIKPSFANGVVDQFKNAAQATQRYSIKDPGVQKVYNIMEDLKTPEFGANHTMRDFENTRGLLGSEVLSKPDFSGISKDLAKKAQQSIEQSLLNVKDIPIVSGDANQAALDLARARAQAFTGFKLEKVDNYLANAGIDAAKQHSGMNLENIIYQKIAPDLKNDAAKLRNAGWNDMEIGALQSVLPGRFAKLVRKAGNYMGGGGGLGGLVSATVGAHALGPLGATLPFVGGFIKNLGAGAAQGKLDRVKQVIGAGAPDYAPYRQQFMQLRGPQSSPLPPFYQQAILGFLASQPKQQ